MEGWEAYITIVFLNPAPSMCCFSVPCLKSFLPFSALKSHALHRPNSFVNCHPLLRNLYHHLQCLILPLDLHVYGVPSSVVVLHRCCFIPPSPLVFLPFFASPPKTLMVPISVPPSLISFSCPTPMPSRQRPRRAMCQEFLASGCTAVPSE